MNPFKTSFNFLIPVLRIAFVLFFVGACAFIFDARSLMLLGIGGIVLIAVARGFIKTTKNYTITEKYIEEKNYLTMSTECIDKSEIKGFSSSYQKYRFWDFEMLIIYLVNGKKIHLVQHTYFNFKDIEPALLACKYTYLGHEPYSNEIGIGRVYKFDN